MLMIILTFEVQQMGIDLNNFVCVKRCTYRSKAAFESLQALEQLETHHMS